MRKYLLLLIPLLYIGCGDGSKYNFHPFLYRLFTTQYFWEQEVPKNISYYKYDTPQAMIDGLKYKPKDRWSVVVTKRQNSNFLNQKSSGGFGFAYIHLEDKNLIIFIRIESPADIAGVQRGDILLKVDDKNITNENMLNAIRNLETPTKFLIYRPSEDKNLTISVQSREYKFKVTLPNIVESTGGKRAGYLRLDSFTAETTEELDEAFTFFKSQNISNLIVDMRYNGGGSVVTASIFLDKLMRDMDDEVQFSITWNSKYQDKNSFYRFETDRNSLNLEKIIFLTTRATASASELVINALKPYMGESVVMIGDRTHGKPVGMEGKTDGVYIYYLVNFVIANSAGFYDYFDGLEVTQGCETPDDFFHQMGDIEEGMLKKALYFLDNGEC